MWQGVNQKGGHRGRLQICSSVPFKMFPTAHKRARGRVDKIESGKHAFPAEVWKSQPIPNHRMFTEKFEEITLNIEKSLQFGVLFIVPESRRIA